METQKRKIKTAVVILNWNGKDWLEKFLPTVVQYSKDATIIVADNGSTDDSISFLSANFPTVSIVNNKENLGFAGGYNKALNQIHAEYYVLLNSDVEVCENWISPIINLMDSDKNIAACQPKLLDFNNRSKFEYAGASGGFIDNLGYPFCRGRIFGSLEEDNGQYNDAVEVFWATGACIFVKAEAFWEVGGFDEEFFAHQEEIDLCWRLKNKGHKIMVEPSSVIYHVGGGTLDAGDMVITANAATKVTFNGAVTLDSGGTGTGTLGIGADAIIYESQSTTKGGPMVLLGSMLAQDTNGSFRVVAIRFKYLYE